MSNKSPITTLNLLLLFGLLGFHRFYVGRYFTGFMQLITMGGLFFWTIYDTYLILSNKFTDSSGKLISLEYKGKKAFAGFWIRFAAFFIDNAIISFVVLVPTIFYIFSNHPYIDREILKNDVNLLNFALGLVYFAVMTASRGQATYGKRLVNIYVSDKTGAMISPTRSVMRYLGYILSSLPFCLGFFTVGITKEKVALHDLMCSTRVYRGKP